MNSTAIQTPAERHSEDFRKAVHVCPRGASPSSLRPSVPSSPPSLELAGLKVFASRDGDRVTGRIEFPYPVGGRTSIPIAYRNAVPSSLRPSVPSSLDAIADARLSLVTRWRELCSEFPKHSRLSLANRIADSAPIKCSPRSLQAWSRKLDTEGPAGLCDRYIPAPPVVLALDPQTASDAGLVCAWWSFRIANAERIDTPMIHSASSILRSEISNPKSVIPLADVLAAIDCYYSWPCDRQRFPFKSFARWARYDFETWLFRACDENDYRRPALEGGFAPTNELDHVSLRPPQTTRWPDVPDPRSRKRDVYDRTTRAAIHTVGSISNLKSDIPDPPSPVVTWLSGLDPRWRGFFLRVAKGDRQAKFELIATLPLWWDGLPEEVRRDIDARLHSWTENGPRTDVQIATRKVLALIPRLREVRGDLTALSAADRMTV